MKRSIALLLAAIICMAMLAACGGSGNSSSADNSGSGSDNGAAEVKTSAFDAGNVSCDVPDGWTAFAVDDLFSDEEGAKDPDAINVAKGADTELDLFTKPYLHITYYGPDSIMMEPSKDFYEDVVDMDDMTIGSYTWHAFSCTSIGYKYVMLWTGEDDGDQFQVSLLYESTDGAVKLEDADVQAIIASIKPSK